MALLASILMALRLITPTTINSKPQLNLQRWLVGGFLVVLLVRLHSVGTCRLIRFPSETAALTAGLPSGPVGFVSVSSILSDTLHDGPEATFGTTTCYSLAEVTLRLTLATLNWDTECVNGAHFGTRVPVTALRLPDRSWTRAVTAMLMGVTGGGSSSNTLISNWEFGMQAQLEAVVEASTTGKAPWFDPYLLLTVNTSKPAVSAARFLVVANLRCEPRGTVSNAYEEVVHNCPRGPDGTAVIITRQRWDTLTCSGDLVSPLAPGVTAHMSDLVLHNTHAACVQTAHDLLFRPNDLCVQP